MPEPAEIRDYLGKSGDTAFRWNLAVAGVCGRLVQLVDIESRRKDLCYRQAYGKAKAMQKGARG